MASFNVFICLYHSHVIIVFIHSYVYAFTLWQMRMYDAVV